MTTTAKPAPLFIARDSAGNIINFYQPSVADRQNFRMVYGIARYDAKVAGGCVEITSTARMGVTA